MCVVKEWEEGHLHDAIHITLGNLFEQLDYIPKDFPIVLQCRTGLRSAIALVFYKELV